MGRLLRVSVHGIDGSWIDLTPESFGTGGAIPLSLRVPIPKDKRDEINWDEFSFKLERTFTSFDDGWTWTSFSTTWRLSATSRRTSTWMERPWRLRW